MPPRDLPLHTPSCHLCKDPHAWPLTPPILPQLLKILQLAEPTGVLSCPWIRFPAVLSVFSSILRFFFAPSCAKVLFPANPRFCPQLDQGPGLGYANFFSPIDLNSLPCFRFYSHFKYTLLLGVLWSLVVVCWTLTNPRSSEVAGNPGRQCLWLRGPSALHVTQKFWSVGSH